MSSLDFYDPNTFCLFEELPSEVAQHLVLSYVDLSYAYTVFCVCKTWLSYRNDRLVKELVYTRFNLPETYQKPQDKDWKWVALSKMPFTAESFNGVGTSTFSDGVYEGEFLNGTMSGVGTFQWKDAVYFGEWEEGLCNGYGVMVWTSGHKYEGYWKAGNQQGTGVFHFSNNDKYGGEWEKGRRHGQGKFNWANGDSYDGEWKEGYREGHGTFVWANGDSYVGDWTLGSRQGTGTLRWANGERYEGEWKNDDRTGQGCFFWSNGDIYKGSWSDSVQEGEGELVWGNGNSFKGVWNKGNKYDGVLFEQPTSRKFRRIQDENNLEVKDEFVHPSIVKATKKNICSFEVTEQQCYFQYLYKTKDNDERTHGVCLACYKSCVPRNGTILFSGKMFFGGNFYCDCGAGNLDSPCWCKTNRIK